MSKQRKHTKKSTMRKKKRRMAEHAREHQTEAKNKGASGSGNDREAPCYDA